MGLEIRLEDERGKKLDSVVDPNNLLPRVLPKLGDPRFCHLNCIDRFGDTTFNRYQIVVFISELDEIAAATRDATTRALLEKIRALAVRCQTETHVYLKFYGD